MGKRKIQPIAGQSLLDIAVQSSGSVEGIIKLAKLNKLPITAPIDMWRLIDEAEEIDRRRRRFFDLRQIRPATEVKPPVEDDGVFSMEFADEFE